MNVVILCEESGTVRDAFIEAGHNAISVDMQPSRSNKGPHHQGDAVAFLRNTRIQLDLAISHPPCTRLTNSGVRWLAPRNLWDDMREGAAFFNLFKGCAPRVCIENPVMHKYARELCGPYTQTIQPWQFGDPQCKRTCLWLENLPPLVPTDVLTPPKPGTPDYWEWRKVHHCPPGPDRAKIRSEFFPGVARAMAEQWGQTLSIIYFDTETKSPNPIRWGLDNYFRPARALLMTYARDDEPVQCVDYAYGGGGVPLPFNEPGYIYIAHNAQFDRRALERLFGVYLPVERFRCTQAQAYAHGLPGSLETLGHVLGIKDKKLVGADGHQLMLFFCVPRSITKGGTPLWNEPHEHPEKWEAFKRYAIRDVEALREIHRKLPTWNYNGVNLDTWFLDQKINERGFGFDGELASAAVKLLDEAKLVQKRGTALVTDGAVGSVTQREKLLNWFNASGLEIASMKASDVREALEDYSLEPAQRYLLELRLEGGKSSGAKYKRGLELCGPDGRQRDSLLYCGANRTGRWAGRGFAPQNLARPRDHWEGVDKANPWKPIEEIAVPAALAGNAEALKAHGGVNSVCNDLVRSAIVAQGNNVLVAADWSNIESRFLAWCTGNTWKIDYFTAVDRGEAADSYKALWALFFGMKVEDVTKKERQASKQVDLACGYLGGTGAMVTMALGNNVDLEDIMQGVWERVPEAIQKKAHKEWRHAFIQGEDFGLKPWVFKSCSAVVKMYRAANKAVVDEGYHIGKVVSEAMRAPNTLYRACMCDIWYTGHALIIELPSKRRLFYWSPQMRDEDTVDIETGEITKREVFWYKASRGKQWHWLKGWAGLWIENLVQASCNDILRLGMLNVQRFAQEDPKLSFWLGTLPDNAATPIALTVHDEIVCDVPAGSLSHEKLEWLITDDLKAKHSWLKGLPLAAAGWTGKRFRK